MTPKLVSRSTHLCHLQSEVRKKESVTGTAWSFGRGFERGRVRRFGVSDDDDSPHAPLAPLFAPAATAIAFLPVCVTDSAFVYGCMDVFVYM